MNQTALFVCPDVSAESPLYASLKDLKQWRINVPHEEARVLDGQKFYRLNAIPGLYYRIDAKTQTVYLNAPAAAFESSIVDGFFSKSPEPQKTPWGGFLNYDFLGTHATSQSVVNGLFEAGLFNEWGVGTSSFLYQDIGGPGDQLLRLDTTWRYDNPKNMTTLEVGDTITRGGMTGASLRMGGIQYGTNFSTRPYFVTFPMPAFQGDAVVPSTVDLYVNGLLRSSEQVPSGPFSVPEIPVVTGPGTATMVVRDALGREHVITTSFYASSSLLKQGLDDYSFTVGKVRRNYGLESNDYGEAAATGLFRHGFSESFTGEAYAEAASGLFDVSLGGSFAAASTGLLNGAVAFSHSDLGRGVLGRFGAQYQWQRFSVGGSIQLASPDFTELGYNGMPFPRRQASVNLGASLGSRGSVYASYLDQDSPLYGPVRLVTGGYSVNLGAAGYLSLNAFHTMSGQSNNGVNLTLTMSFGNRTTLTTGVLHQNSDNRGFAQLQKSLPVGTGSGYLVRAEAGPNPTTQGEFDYQTGFGTYRVGALNTNGQTIYQGEASGGLAFIGGGLFASRKIDNSFALVKVPDIPGVTVFADNQPVAVTDGKGEALIPNLRAYQSNQLRLGLRNLPLGAQVNSLNMDAVPRYRSGVVEKFSVTDSHGATLTVRLAGGQPLPAGARVHVIGHQRNFPVGLNGEVYLTGLARHNILQADWGQQSCRFTVDFPDTSAPIPDLGVFTCSGIHL